jgi:hypothetical protein
MERLSPSSIALYPANQHERSAGGRDGLTQPFHLLEIRGQVPTECYDSLAHIYVDGDDIPFRAIRSYPSHLVAWNKLRPGDWALFYRRPTYYARAQLAFRWPEPLPELARIAFPTEVRQGQRLDDLFCFFESSVTFDVPLSRTQIGMPGPQRRLRFNVIGARVEVERIANFFPRA